MSDLLSTPGLIVFDGTPEHMGRPRQYEGTEAQRKQASKKNAKAAARKLREENIAVLDMETDPFDNKERTKIFPFCACLYSKNFDPVIIWQEDPIKFIEEVTDAILALPDEYTIYAHNGGKFDWLFLISKLRGKVSFKGRGIMSAKIGPHEIRDSFHIIPEKLAAYQKEVFDYDKMRKGKRRAHKQEILNYLVSDCVYLLDIVLGFIATFGRKISIGQAAMSKLKEVYKVENIGERTDETLRQFFYGGRVEALQGRGHFSGDYKLYDVNSMYPAAMASYKHPISGDYTKRTKGGMKDNTCFVELTCTNHGALIAKTPELGTTATIRKGRFFTTRYEYETALDLGLIENVKIHAYLDCKALSDFSQFVIPLYEKRLETKSLLKTLDENSREYQETKKDDIFTKLLLNNAYGKFAQNPRRFKESYIADPSEPCPEGYDAPAPFYENELYAIWQRPSPTKRFNNVGTAASITGAARSILMRAIANATDPIYCDTDSLICKDLANTKIHATELGAWDIENEFSEVIIVGKKMYACKLKSNDPLQKPKYKIRSKGVSGLEWEDFVRMLDGEILEVLSKAPTLTKTGSQVYMSRRVRATAPIMARETGRKIAA